MSNLMLFIHGLSAVIADIGHWGNYLSGYIDFAVQGAGGGGAAGGSDCDPCPASAFTSIAAAWANIGYHTQSDLLYYISLSKFGLWAPLMYACAAIGGLIGVVTGMPPRNYMWFFLGPALYAWLIDSQQEVVGVKWQVAGVDQDQKIVWRDAEVGIANTNIAKRLNIEAYKDKKPNKEVSVAMPFLFVDELLSSQIQWLIGWTGVYTAKGKGSADSNLAQTDKADGPWYIMSNLKWGMIENVTAATLRNPDLRDAFVTFLASECGDKFKQSVHGGSYIAVTQGKGAKMPKSVFKDKENYVPDDSDEGPETRNYDYVEDTLGNTWIPTPRSLTRLLESGEADGEFGAFAKDINKTARENGRNSTIFCNEYLWLLIQGFRWEAGHSYWQLLRAAPAGLDKDQFIRTLFYGWNIREKADGNYASNPELHDFLKHLIFIHIWRNELQMAPAIVDIKYAPSDQAKSFSDAYARTMGSKNKAGELFQWAMMMPHLQGILLYLLIIAYPFACMMIVVPGWHKTIFTWMSFFAWVKLWDLGFAMTQVLERSVWAMIGNSSYFSKVAQMVVKMRSSGQIDVKCPSGSSSSGSGSSDLYELAKLCSVPAVTNKSGTGTSSMQEWGDAMGQLDTALILGSGLDLDLSNAYYIFIMAALYFAIPAITGQLVLGARAGAAGMVSNMVGGVAGEAGKAAGSAYSGITAGLFQTNSGSTGQAAALKNMRQSGLAGQYLDALNKQLDLDAGSAFMGQEQKGLGNLARAAGLNARSFETEARFMYGAGVSSGGLYGGKKQFSGTPATKGAGGTGADGAIPPDRLGGAATMLGAGARFGVEALHAKKNQDAIGYEANSLARGADLEWMALGNSLAAKGTGIGANRLQSQMAFESDMASWDARNQFAVSASGAASVAGLFAGALNPGQKPSHHYDGMALAGQLGGLNQSRAAYAGGGFVAGSLITSERGRSLLGGGATTSIFSQNGDNPNGYTPWGVTRDTSIHSATFGYGGFNSGKPATSPLPSVIRK